jgi:hypothetical protein
MRHAECKLSQLAGFFQEWILFSQNFEAEITSTRFVPEVALSRANISHSFTLSTFVTTPERQRQTDWRTEGDTGDQDTVQNLKREHFCHRVIN